MSVQKHSWSLYVFQCFPVFPYGKHCSHYMVAETFNENLSMRAVAKILRARASEHSSNLCEQWSEKRPKFASTFKYDDTIPYPLKKRLSLVLSYAARVLTAFLVLANSLSSFYWTISLWARDLLSRDTIDEKLNLLPYFTCRCTKNLQTFANLLLTDLRKGRGSLSESEPFETLFSK